MNVWWDCPIAKELGCIGKGEGLVWEGHADGGKRYCFKTKGPELPLVNTNLLNTAKKLVAKIINIDGFENNTILASQKSDYKNIVSGLTNTTKINAISEASDQGLEGFEGYEVFELVIGKAQHNEDVAVIYNKKKREEGGGKPKHPLDVAIEDLVNFEFPHRFKQKMKIVFPEEITDTENIKLEDPKKAWKKFPTLLHELLEDFKRENKTKIAGFEFNGKKIELDDNMLKKAMTEIANVKFKEALPVVDKPKKKYYARRNHIKEAKRKAKQATAKAASGGLIAKNGKFLNGISFNNEYKIANIVETNDDNNSTSDLD